MHFEYGIYKIGGLHNGPDERYICIFLKNLSITDIIWYDGICSLKADDF